MKRSTLIHSATPLSAVPDEPVWVAPFVKWAAQGVLERPGAADHPLIVEMLRRVGLPQQHDETPWCSAAMNAAMEESGIGGTGRANARSWEAWGTKLDRPRFGCVAVLWRESRHTGHGHVACWLGDVAGGQMVLLGGNQSNRVGVALYPAHRLLSYRWPDQDVIGDPAMRPTMRDEAKP